ncbi:HlyD family efflux transporter periplasmic adaptor subunit [Halomonas sp. WWR20]
MADHTPPNGSHRQDGRDNDDTSHLDGSHEHQLGHERRDERHFIRVQVPFSVKFEDGRSFSGQDLSLGGFSLVSQEPFETGQVASVSLLITAGTAELIVPATARVIRDENQGKHETVAFELTQIDKRHRELLRRVIRAHLSGRYASVEALLDEEDPQTPHKRNKANANANPQRQSKPWGRYVALILAALVLFAVAAATAYRNFMLIEPDFAAVTAPRIDILSPGAGQLSEHDLQPGDRVQRDQPLARVKDSDLETDLILARAAHSYNAQLIDNMRERFDDPSVQQVSMAQSTTPSDGRPPSFETVSPEIAKVRIEQFETARDYENARIDALEARMASNTIYSPCDCLVAWALSSGGGTYINESDRIMTLIRTGPDEVMVEALVHMDKIGDIEPHQLAYIALPNASEPIAARVRSVALDVERQPRAGFPEWVRQQQNVASVLLVPEEPLPASAVGVPVDVRFSEAPVLDETVEWVWQGGRAVAQQTAHLFSTAKAKIYDAVQ